MSGPPSFRYLIGGVDWFDFAACRGLSADLFHPRRGETTVPAKQVCHNCPVCDLCLEYALDTGKTLGVWGGLSARQRIPLRQARARRAS